MASEIQNIIQAIEPVDPSLKSGIQSRLDDLTKPQGSLGRLEECALRLGLIQNTMDPQVSKKRFYVFAADHGVVVEGVSPFPQEITAQMVLNMLNGGAGINVLGRHAGAEVRVVDVGIASDFDETSHQAGLISRKVMPGSRNLSKEPAMSEQEMLQAFAVGVEMAQQAKSDGIDLLGTGEMGIGNTTPSTALFASLLPCSVAEVTGPGAGLDEQGLQHKMEVVWRALDLHSDLVQERDPARCLAALGGLEITALTGLILQGAALRIGLVIDGFISSAAALVAYRLCPSVKDYLFFSHLSAERGHRVFCEMIGVHPLLDLDLRLGEGTGAALAMQIIDASMKMYHEMNTFSGAGVDKVKHG